MFSVASTLSKTKRGTRKGANIFSTNLGGSQAGLARLEAIEINFVQTSSDTVYPTSLRFMSRGVTRSENRQPAARGGACWSATERTLEQEPLPIVSPQLVEGIPTQERRSGTNKVNGLTESRKKNRALHCTCTTPQVADTTSNLARQAGWGGSLSQLVPWSG